jgi:hypothetical protein
MSAAPSAHARILDFFMTMLPLRAGVRLRRGTAPLPVSEQNCSLWTDDSDRYRLAT